MRAYEVQESMALEPTRYARLYYCGTAAFGGWDEGQGRNSTLAHSATELVNNGINSRPGLWIRINNII